MKALIIENSRLYRQLLDTLLGQQGFESDITDEFQQAKNYLDNNHYDIICLNDNLKNGSGLELASYCRKHNELKSIPILFFSSDENIAHKIGYLQLEGIIYKRNLQQISEQIIDFLETRFDPHFHEGRILLIEDSDSIGKVIQSALQQKGYKVEYFTSAERAWTEFKNEVSYGSDSQAYDLVITDINVKGEMDGLQLTHLIRQLDDARGFIPIIAITAHSNDKLRISLYKAGINDFIPKPILIEELLIRVSNLITNKRLLDKVHDQRRELLTMATTDKLTGCHNRHSLMDFSLKFISQAIRGAYPISVLVIDLDHFKKVNDNHGHATGDKVLEATGQLLNSSFREGDLVARFGGEEFVILLNQCDQDHAMTIAENFRQQLLQLKPAGLSISASIGVACLDVGQKHEFEALFAAADQAVYQAKENGRNQVCFVEAS